MATYMQGAIKSGSTPSEYQNVGHAIFSQSAVVTTNADGSASSATIVIPAGSQIVDYKVDGVVDAVVGGGTATAIAVTVGTAAAGAQYMTSTDMVAGGRATTAITTAQAAAMDDVGTNTAVVITADPNGTIVTTQAQYRLTVLYSPKD